MQNLTFITGGARSGKSLLAEQIASKSGREVIYMATMQIMEDDPEQINRVEMHRKRRPKHWQTLHVPFIAHQTINCLPKSPACIVFDCISLYVTNILLATTGGTATAGDPYSKDQEVITQIDLLLEAISTRGDLQFVVVSNEVGWGLVPDTALGRAFRDFLGLANQRIAAQASSVFLTCAGLNIQLK